MKKILAGFVSIVICISLLSTISFSADADVTVAVDFSGEKTEISEYIYGVNDWADTEDATCLRQGGNRYTGYNWENNYSNAGRDWHHYSDTYLINDLPSEYKSKSGATALYLSKQAKGRYKLATLQMAGYVSADANREVFENETAPSSRWKEVKFSKGSAFSLTPDKNDNYVYMDEYVNYLVSNLGDSTTENGINGYLLDNEPGLWEGTHPRIHPEDSSYAEIIDKSVELAKAVKAVDKNAEIYGPALFGIGAYDNFADAPDVDESYDWFISYYLDNMKKAEEKNGQRLLDVLDVHYYTEAMGKCRVTNCDDTSHIDCIKARLQSVRSLDEEGYYENSWIGKWKKDCLPVLSRVKESIDTYYPGTKLSLTEYSFGGGDQISGAITEADALGTFARNGVYLATLWDDGEYQLSAISLYTNYDKNGAKFGDTFVPSTTSNIELTTAYASIHSDNAQKANLVVTNKSLDSSKKIEVSLNGTDKTYETATVWGITEGSSEIKKIDDVVISGNKFTVELPALTVAQIELNTNEANTDVGGDTDSCVSSDSDSDNSDSSDSDSDNNDNKEKGDVNLDGKVNIVDVVLVRSHIVHIKDLSTLDDGAIARADMNGDGKINIVDVVLMRSKIISK